MKIVIDTDKIQNEIPSGVVCDVMDGIAQPSVVIDFLAHFAADDEEKPLGHEAGKQELRKLPFAQISEIMNATRKAAEDALVPPASARV